MIALYYGIKRPLHLLLPLQIAARHRDHTLHLQPSDSCTNYTSNQKARGLTCPTKSLIKASHKHTCILARFISRRTERYFTSEDNISILNGPLNNCTHTHTARGGMAGFHSTSCGLFDWHGGMRQVLH